MKFNQCVITEISQNALFIGQKDLRHFAVVQLIFSSEGPRPKS